MTPESTETEENIGAEQEVSSPLVVAGYVDPLSERVTNALAVSRAYLTQLVDPEAIAKAERRIGLSAVRGSVVMGLNNHDDVATMLAACTGWHEVTANLSDTEIIVVQGVLPVTYKAFAAYATVREIEEMFGKPGLDAIKTAKGYQKEGEYYLHTPTQYPTGDITVQLKKDVHRVEGLVMWFAGIERTSRTFLSTADVEVRCNTKIPSVQPRRRPFHGHQR